MTPDRHGSGSDGSSVLDFPSDLEVRLTRTFEAPIQLVFDVLLKPEHMRHTIAPFGEEVTLLEVDLRVGGDYHYIFVTDDGTECSFRGTFLEIDEPHRSVQTWHFDGWPDTEATETMQLSESDGVTTMSWTLAFADAAGRARMSKFDGVQANFDNVANYLATLVGR